MSEHINSVSTTLKIASMDVFQDSHKYINGTRMFFAYFGTFPSIVSFWRISPLKLMSWIESSLKEAIVHRHYRNSASRSGDFEMVNVIYILSGQIMIDIEDDGCVTVLFDEGNGQGAKHILEKVGKFKVKKRFARSINLIAESRYGLDLLPVKIKRPKLDLTLNYNDDLIDVHKHLISSLKQIGKSGLILLHGIPGTGKSTYIRYLIHYLKKKIIFLPPKIAASLDSPGMSSMLVENSNSVFIIEDAEELIKSRESQGGSNISMLLNLTDGMLGESLGIQVICTFNTKVGNIDSALLRNGRLIANYEFKELHPVKTEKLLKSIGRVELLENRAMTLADVYNGMQSSVGHGNIIKHKIGFLDLA
jgi:hypothetical protein